METLHLTIRGGQPCSVEQLTLSILSVSLTLGRIQFQITLATLNKPSKVAIPSNVRVYYASEKRAEEIS